MSDIDVEPVEDIGDDADGDGGEGADGDAGDGTRTATDPVAERRSADLAGAAADAPEYVLYGGKGGVGKTTMAAATGLASAHAGDRTLVVSTDPAHSLSDSFEREVPAEPARIREDVPLYAVEIDPDEAMAEAGALFGGGDGDADGDDPAGATPGGPGPGTTPGGEGGAGPTSGGGPMGGLADALGGENPMETLFGGAVPGADEAAAMQELMRLLDDDRFDRVVVDTAPTGHTLRLLQLPEALDTMVGRTLQWRERLSGMFGGGLTGLFGDDDEDPGDPFESDDLQVLRERIERLRSVLRDPARTDFRVVMVPEGMSVTESGRLVDRLVEFGIPVETVVVNRVMEDLADVVGEDVDDAAFVGPDREHCEFCRRRWQVQQEALREAQELFRGHRVERVPLFADEVRGERALELVARCLA